MQFKANKWMDNTFYPTWPSGTEVQCAEFIDAYKQFDEPIEYTFTREYLMNEVQDRAPAASVIQEVETVEQVVDSLQESEDSPTHSTPLEGEDNGEESNDITTVAVPGYNYIQLEVV
jgi:hypothetical protein